MEFELLVGSVGFPIAMCFYLITRFEKSLQDNTRALQALKDCIGRVKK